MSMGQWRYRLLAVLVPAVWGCSATHLYVSNETDHALRMRIDDREVIYELQPDSKYDLGERLTRNRLHRLTIQDRRGRLYEHPVKVDEPRLFVVLREAASGGLQWQISSSSAKAP